MGTFCAGCCLLLCCCCVVFFFFFALISRLSFLLHIKLCDRIKRFEIGLTCVRPDDADGAWFVNHVG